MIQFLLLLTVLQQATAASPDFATPPGVDPAEMQAVVQTTAGEFVIEFYPEQAPGHVAHFVNLVRENFYTGTTFHSMFEHGITKALAGDTTLQEVARVTLDA